MDFSPRGDFSAFVHGREERRGEERRLFILIPGPFAKIATTLTFPPFRTPLCEGKVFLSSCTGKMTYVSTVFNQACVVKIWFVDFSKSLKKSPFLGKSGLGTSEEEEKSAH